MGLQKIIFIEPWEILPVLAPAAAALAAWRAPPASVERLFENIGQMESRLTNDAEVIRLDVEFRGLVAEATGNRELILSEAPIGQLLYPATKQLYSRSRRRGIDNSTRIAVSRRRSGPGIMRWRKVGCANMSRISGMAV